LRETAKRASITPVRQWLFSEQVIGSCGLYQSHQFYCIGNHAIKRTTINVSPVCHLRWTRRFVFFGLFHALPTSKMKNCEQGA
jgi:hypothetical protein